MNDMRRPLVQKQQAATTTETKPTTKSLSDLFGSKSFGIARTFEYMGVAEALLEKHGLQKHPSAFRLVFPGDPVFGKALPVVESHMEELLQRLLTGADTRPGTRAEVLCSLLEAALQTPLQAGGLAILEHLWPQVTGCSLPYEGERVAEPWPGYVEETLPELQRKTRQEWRK